MGSVHSALAVGSGIAVALIIKEIKIETSDAFMLTTALLEKNWLPREDYGQVLIGCDMH